MTWLEIVRSVILQAHKDCKADPGLDLSHAIDNRMTAALKEAYVEGIRTFAIWKDGQQVCGALETPLRDVIKKIDRTGGPLL